MKVNSLFSEQPTINLLKHIDSKDVPWDSEAFLKFRRDIAEQLDFIKGKQA